MKSVKNIFNKIKNSGRRTKIIFVILILVVLFLFLRGRKKPIVLNYQTVMSNNISSDVTASGIVSGKAIASLHFNSSGKLRYFNLSSGDNVLKGQVIATLDTIALNSNLQQALNNRRNTQANVDYIHDQLKDHSGDETFAQKATRTAAEVANDNAYDAILAARKALSDAILYSPINGVVVAKGELNPGQNVSVSDLIAEVVDFSEKEFDATVDESDIGQINIGQSAKVTLNAYGETDFDGKVVEIGSQTKTDTTGSVTVIVKIRLDDPRITNIYGLNGQATIITNLKQNVLTITQDALIDDNHVYVKLTNGKTEKREITTGIKSDTDIEVVSGLSHGEQIVTNPQAVTAK